jgi:hypothetical protein
MDSIVCRSEILKFAAADFVLQDGVSCLLQITAVYSSYTGVSSADLIIGHVSAFDIYIHKAASS